MKKPPHLLFCINRLEDASGGAERVLADIARGLSQRGYRITVVSFDRPEAQSFYPLSDAITHLRLGRPAVTATPPMPSIVTRMRALRQTVKQLQPDIVIGFLISMYAPLAFALAGTGTPVIASEHIVRQHYRSRKLQYLLLGAAARLSAKMAFLSPRIAEGYQIVPATKRIVLPDPVAPAQKFADPAGPDTAPKTILNIGRMVAFKDQETLIRAFHRVAGEFPDWQLRIIGDGKLRSDLEELASDLGLKDRVLFPGTTDAIKAEYLGAQIFAMSSQYEGFGLVTAEASAHGLPCIGFAGCPGTNDIIVHEQNGLLVGGDDKTSTLAEGLRQLMTNAELRIQLGQTGRTLAERYSLSTVLEKWEFAIQETLIC